GYAREARGAAVDADGNPVFYDVPKSFQASTNDGQRWRWCLTQAVEYNPSLLNHARKQLADFLHNQFGVQTLQEYGWRFGLGSGDEEEDIQNGIFGLHTLAENETIARLATGVKRFKLPGESNYIKIYRRIADEPKQTGYCRGALEQLARIFENRRQYHKSADYWRRLLEDYPRAGKNRRQEWKEHLEQIEENWGRFEPVLSRDAGKGATVEYRFRNGSAVEFIAHQIKFELLIEDVKAYLKSDPAKISWQKVDVGNVGHRLIAKDQKKYLGPEVARWSMELTPRDNHFDRRVTVATPLSKAGVYLLEAKMKDGNRDFIVLWLDDLAIVKKPLDNAFYYYVGQAENGKPVAKANVEFFGWRQEHRGNRQFDVLVKNFAEYTDADGKIIVDAKQQPPGYQWIVIARAKDKGLAFLGFSGVWYSKRYDQQYNATKVYAITDRPVYRPDQGVKYKFWVRHARYDMGNTSEFA
ncbi:MAG: alpha-2-macroglobulin, partial [Thermoguttaceae bacterium]